MVNCNVCGEEFSRPDSLSRHLNRKNACVRKNFIVGHQNTCSVPDKSETVMGIGVKRQYGANDDRSPFAGENTIPVNNDKKRKTSEKKSDNPKMSAFAKTIIDREPSSKDKSFLVSLSIPPTPKTLTSNKLFPVKKTPPRVDDSAEDDNESYSGIEPVDMTTKDNDEDEDEDDDYEDDDDEMPDPVTDPEEVLPVKIKDTVEYLIRHDKAEIDKLLKNFLHSNEKGDVVR